MFQVKGSDPNTGGGQCSTRVSVKHNKYNGARGHDAEMRIEGQLLLKVVINRH
jgi:hypothetical protein